MHQKSCCRFVGLESGFGTLLTRLLINIYANFDLYFEIYLD
jgi:hypothetical protein